MKCLLQLALVSEVNGLDVVDEPVLGKVDGGVIYGGFEGADLGYELFVDLLVGVEVRIASLCHHTLLITEVVLGDGDEFGQGIGAALIGGDVKDALEQLFVFLVKEFVEDGEGLVPAERLRNWETHVEVVGTELH